jgi:hypothetical protein
MDGSLRHGSHAPAYRWGIGIAMATALLTVWTTIVHDDGSGAGAFMLVLASAMAWFATGGHPAGMARGLFGVAVMHLALGALVATAPVTARMPGAVPQAILGALVFAMGWLLAAACFRRAARVRQGASDA